MEEKKILGPDGKEIKKLETIELVIPEDIKKKIDEKREARAALSKEFMEISLRRAVIVQREQEILKLLGNNSDALQGKIKFAYKKLKLDKNTEYDYSYDIAGKFIGYPKKKKS